LSAEERADIVKELTNCLEAQETTLGQLTDLLECLNSVLDGKRMELSIDWKIPYKIY